MVEQTSTGIANEDDATGKVFLITPFSARTAGNENEALFQQVQSCIEQAAKRTNVTLVRADDIFAPGVVMQQIRQAIEQSDVVIGVCTGRNANVFFELGLAEVLGHKPILVASKKEDLPFDVAHWRAQFYGSHVAGQDITSLGNRIECSIQAALEESLRQKSEQALSVKQSIEKSELNSSRTQPGVLNVPGVEYPASRQTRVNDVLAELASEHERIAGENRDVSPTDEVMGELRDNRFQLVSELLDVAVDCLKNDLPVLERAAVVMRNLFARSATGQRHGITFWIALHQSWTGLALRSMLLEALNREAWPAVAFLLRIDPVSVALDVPNDRSPLMINPAFTWAYGYQGGPGAAFDDLKAFIEQRVAPILGAENDPTSLVCGADLVLGMARCVWEAHQGESPAKEWGPHAYAAFKPYYCERIQWIAQRLDRDQSAAMALGAVDLEEFQEIAATWYPFLRERGPERFGMDTCDSWAEAARSLR